VLPFIKGGVLSDFTIENAAVTFGVTGGTTRDGNAWADSPYRGATGGYDMAPPTVFGVDDNGSRIAGLHKNDHLGVGWTTDGYPSDSDGCQTLVVPTTMADVIPAANIGTAGALTGNQVAGSDDPTAVTTGVDFNVYIKRNVDSAGQAPSGTKLAVFPANGPVTVHWGDGKSDTIAGTASTAKHQYAKAGKYHATIETVQGVNDVVINVTVT
jgi:hypothetical protein